MNILLKRSLPFTLPFTLTFPFSKTPTPPAPTVPYNINMEQYANYLKKLQRSDNQLKEEEKINRIPRRKRRIYDRERIDRNIQGYGAFRIFEQEDLIYKINQHCMPVVRKIMIQPKWLVHAFGMGSISINNPRSSHREYQFMDNQLNKYLLYEYRNTTHFKPNVQGYDYGNQLHIRPRQRIKARLSPEQFWKSQDKFQFRVNATLYALQFKFEQWLLQEIQKRKIMKSYDQFIDEKFGKVYTFNKKEEKDCFEVLKPMVLELTADDFEPKQQKIEKKEKSQKKEKVQKKQKEKKKVQKQKQEKQVEQKSEKTQESEKVEKSQKQEQQRSNKQVRKVPVATKLDEKYRIRPKITLTQQEREENKQKQQTNKAV